MCIYVLQNVIVLVGFFSFSFFSLLLLLTWFTVYLYVCLMFIQSNSLEFYSKEVHSLVCIFFSLFNPFSVYLSNVSRVDKKRTKWEWISFSLPPNRAYSKSINVGSKFSLVTHSFKTQTHSKHITHKCRVSSFLVLYFSLSLFFVWWILFSAKIFFSFRYFCFSSLCLADNKTWSVANQQDRKITRLHTK